MTFGDAQKKESLAKLWLVGKKDELIGYHSTLARKLSSLTNKVDRDVPMTLCRHTSIIKTWYTFIYFLNTQHQVRSANL